MASAPGGFAEYAVTDAGRVHRIPGNNMTYEQAACFPVALQTMHNAVVTAGRLQRGETLLDPGRQLRRRPDGHADRQADGRVAGHWHLDQCRAPGAAQGIRLRSSRIDTGEPDWPDGVKKATGGKGVDLIVDMISGGVAERQSRSRENPRPHRQCRPARRQQGRIRFRQACAQAHRLYRRHLPHPHAPKRCARSSGAARRPVAGGGSRQALACRSTRPSRSPTSPRRLAVMRANAAFRQDRDHDVVNTIGQFPACGARARPALICHD